MERISKPLTAMALGALCFGQACREAADTETQEERLARILENKETLTAACVTQARELQFEKLPEGDPLLKEEPGADIYEVRGIETLNATECSTLGLWLIPDIVTPELQKRLAAAGQRYEYPNFLRTERGFFLIVPPPETRKI